MERKDLSRKAYWTGTVMRWLVVAFMLFDGIIKFLKPEPVIRTTINELGYRESHIAVHGITALVSTLLFALPRTRILGAILLTAHLGGAIASQLRVDHPLFSHTLFPVYVGLIMWGSIWILDKKCRDLLPVVNKRAQ